MTEKLVSNKYLVSKNFYKEFYKTMSINELKHKMILSEKNRTKTKCDYMTSFSIVRAQANSWYQKSG